jgi:hypothetical protein
LLIELLPLAYSSFKAGKRQQKRQAPWLAFSGKYLPI